MDCMVGKNVMGAGNQQERLDAEWVVGFVDGEGCFHVAINRQHRMTIGWQVLPEFRVVQHKNDEQILHKLQSFFGCGRVTVNNGDRKELRIRGLTNLGRIVNFFKHYPLKTKKLHSFEKFATIVDLMRQGRHLDREGLSEIARLTLEMNKRKNTSASKILRDCTPDTPKGEDTVRPPQRCGEASRNDWPAFERRS